MSVHEKEEQYNREMSTMTAEPKELGLPCTRNMDCNSYKCAAATTAASAPTKCVENKVCRLAEKGDPAPIPATVRCAQPYEKIDGVCKERAVGFYFGKLDGLAVRPIGGQQCQFELDPTNPNMTTANVRDAATIAVLSARAMEWMFATSSVNNHEDCLYTVRWMRGKMQTLVSERKEIVREFSRKFNLMEKDFQKISTAKKDDPTQLQTPCGEVTTAHDVSMRRATGLDFLCYLRNRNELFLDYEAKMKAHMAKMMKLADGYTSSWTWEDTAKKWRIGKTDPSGEDHVWEDQECRNWPRWHQKIKRRWGQKFTVNGTTNDNKSVLDANEPDLQIGTIYHKYIDVNDYLGFVGHRSKEDAAQAFKKSRYWLLDPLMPGGQQNSVNFENFGAGDTHERQLGHATWWQRLIAPAAGMNSILGMINSPQALINTTGFLGIHAKFRPNLIAHLKSFKSTPTDKDFIFEPEIPSSFENRVCLEKADSPECARTKLIQERGGCIENLNEPECRLFKMYVDNLQDVSFAQMISYSRHDKKKYVDYFKNENSWRQLLFKRYAIDFKNLEYYYDALRDLRSRQNSCINAVVGQLRSPEFNGRNMGLVQGAKNYYAEGPNRQGTKATRNSTPAAAKKESFNPYKIDINTKTMGSTNKAPTDSLKDSSSAQSGDITAGSGAMAAALKSMDDVNKKALAKGGDFAAREKALMNSITSSGGKSGSGSGSGSGSLSPEMPSLNSGDSGSKAALDEEAKPAGDATKGEATPASGAAGASSSSGLGSASGSGYGSSSEGSTTTDSSGMSDEEKETMAANYDRTKRDYKTSEEDSLFQVLSKTYVRNLNKILIRKKKPDSGNNE